MKLKYIYITLIALTNLVINSCCNIHKLNRLDNKDIKKGTWISIPEESRNLLEVACFKNGVFNGNYFLYYESGQIKVKGKYKDGKKDGKWFFFRTNGDTYKTIKYRNDSLISLSNSQRGGW